MQKKKIVIGITKGTWGGAQKNVFDIATSLSPTEFDVCVITGTPGILVENLRLKNIRTITIRALARDVHFIQEVRAFFSLITILRKERPDIVHLHSPKMGGLGVLAACMVGIKNRIYTPHGWAFYEKRSRISRWGISCASWFTVFLSTKVIVFSEDDRKKTIHLLGAEKKIVVIPNGISCPEFPDKNGARSALRIFPAEENAVGTIAELHPNKGLSYALEAFAKLPPSFSFHIIGAGDLANTLKDLAKKLHIENRVYWHGFMENASAYLKAFDMFLLPSQKEGFPYALLEAGCAGLPTVATSVGSISEIIHDKKTGLLIPPQNSQAIAEALTYLAQNKSEGERYAENLKRLVETQFSTAQMIQKLLLLYRS